MDVTRGHRRPPLAVRPYVARSFARPEGLVGAVLSQPDCWRDAATRAVVALEGSRVIGGGRFWSSPVHPRRYWIEIAVVPDRRRQGIGTDIAEHLARLRPRQAPFCARGAEGSVEVDFARSLGATPYQFCPPQRVPAGAAALLDTRVATLDGSHVDHEELIRAWIEIYRWVHASWSPVGDGAEPILRAELEKHLDLTDSRFVIAADGTIRAAAFVFDDDEPCIVAECRTADEPNGVDLLRACVRDALSALAVDHATITFDGHQSDPHFRALLEELPTTGPTLLLLEWDPGHLERSGTNPAGAPASRA